MKIFSINFDENTKMLQFLDNSENVVVEIPTSVKKASTSRKKKEENESNEPKMILEENKAVLTSAAVDLLGVEPGNTLAIGFIKQGKKLVPAIGIPEVLGLKGNKLTKSNTIACKGKAHDELVKYGTEFTLVPNPDGTTSFILNNGSLEIEDSYVEDDSITENPDAEVISKLESFAEDDLEDIDVMDASNLMGIVNS